MSAGSAGFYEWSGRTVKRHRAEIRAHFGFRQCAVVDADEIAGWLPGGHPQEERRDELVRDELLAECRSRSIEPPTLDRVERILRPGLHQAEKILTAPIWARLPTGGAGTAAGAGQHGRRRGRLGPAGLLGKDIRIAVKLPGEYHGDGELADGIAIRRWTTVVLHPDELGWLREALALNAEGEDPDDEDE